MIKDLRIDPDDNTLATGVVLELVKEVIDRAERCRSDSMRVSSVEFWAFVKALNAKVEIDARGEFVTMSLARRSVRLEPTTSPEPETHAFRVTPTNDEGIHTGRRRYKVECISCNKLLHEATTGALERIEQHLREVERNATPMPPTGG